MSSVTSFLASEIIPVAAVVVSVFALRRSMKKDKKEEKKAKAVEHDLEILAEAERKAFLENLAKKLNDVSIKLEKETGGNSGGLREKLDSHADFVEKKFAVVEKKQDEEAKKSEKVADIVHKLEGQVSVLLPQRTAS